MPIFSVVFPYFGKEVLSMEAQHFGLTQSSFPAGLLLGTLIINLLTKKYGKHLLLIGGIVGQGIIVLLLSVVALPSIYQNIGTMTIVISFMGPMLILGILNIFVNVPLQVTIQETVPDRYLGRVSGLIDSLVQMLVPISMALFGALVDVIALFTFIPLWRSCLACRTHMASSAGIRSLYRDTPLESGQ